jgi:hypothetical protein
MGVQDAAKLPCWPGAVPIRRVRVTRPVGESMMPPVGSYPALHVALKAHRACDCQGNPKRGPGGEAPVRQAPVESHRHPEPGQQVEEHRQPDVCEADTVAP